MENIAIVILAAGSSSRMGRPKQLLPFRGTTLLRHVAETALEAGAGSVTVVLGSQASLLQPGISDLPLEIVINDQWTEGMASSIRVGLENIVASAPAVSGVIFLVCDQPFITSSLLQELITTHLETRQEIVASAYGDTMGTPVFFHKNLFKDLLQLEGARGAKTILLAHPEKTAVVAFPKGVIDIDSPGDYDALTGILAR